MRGIFSHGSKTKLGIMLKRVLPAGWPQTHVVKPRPGGTFTPTQVGECHLLPPLAEARRCFEKFTGMQGLFDAADAAAGSSEGDLPDLPNLHSISEQRERRDRPTARQPSQTEVGEAR
jgi:hypothetical protein